MPGTIFSIVCLCTLLWTANGQDLKTVMQATWSQTPLIMEASEFLSRLDDRNFWSFANDLADLPTYTNDKDELNTALLRASRIVDALFIPLMNISLALREFSPTVEANAQLAKNALSTGDDSENCKNSKAFVVVNGGKVVCNKKTLETTLASLTGSAPALYDFDHKRHAEGLDIAINVAVLYGHLGTESFHFFYNVLNKNKQKYNLTFAVRHYTKGRTQIPRKPRLSGYGIELAIKNMEYKAVDDRAVQDEETQTMAHVFAEMEDDWEEEEKEQDLEGIDFHRLKDLHVDHQDGLEQLRQHLLKAAEITPIKPWELQSLGLQATERVIKAGGSLTSLRILKDICQNLPSRAARLIKDKVNTRLQKEVEKNLMVAKRELHIDPVEGLFLINGVSFPPLNVNPFEISEHLRQDALAQRLLTNLGVPPLAVPDFLATNDPFLVEEPITESGNKPPVYVDIRTNGLLWANDLEHDIEYKDLPKTLALLFKPPRYNNPHKLARNILNTVFVIQPTDPAMIRIFQILKVYREHRAAMRFGFIFFTKEARKEPATLSLNRDTEENDEDTNDVDSKLLRIMQFLRVRKGDRVASDCLQSIVTSGFTKESMKNCVKNIAENELQAAEWNNILTGDEYDTLRQTSNAFVRSTGLVWSEKRYMYINGKQYPVDLQNLDRMLFQAILEYQEDMADALTQRELPYKTTDVLDWFLNKPTVVRRFNRLLTGRLASVGPITFLKDSNVKFNDMSIAEQAGAIISKLKYFESAKPADHPYDITHMVVSDLSTFQGIRLVFEALTYMTYKRTKGVRLTVIPNIASGIGREIAIALHSLQYSQPQSVALHLSRAILAKMYAYVKVNLKNMSDKRTREIVMNLVKKEDGCDFKLFLEKSRSDSVKDILSQAAHLANRILKLNPGKNAVITNGKIIGPLNSGDMLLVDDIKMIETRAREWSSIITKLWHFYSESNKPISQTMTANQLTGVMSVLAAFERKRYSPLSALDTDHSMVHVLPSDGAIMNISIVWLLDPLSKAAQRLIQIVMALQSSLGADVKLYLVPTVRLSSMPLNRYYRYVIQTTPSFSREGKMLGPLASFSDLPRLPLLTLAVDSPSGWDMQPVSSLYDLDNIHMMSVKSPGIYASFELSHILIEGQCKDEKNKAATGLNLYLGTPQQFHIADTLVMENLGYFQIKTNPGVWNLRIRPGRSAELYSFADGSVTTNIFLRSFSGALSSIQVMKRPGKETANLLDKIGTDDLANKIITENKKSNKKKALNTEEHKGEIINVFSLASGHLYERFLCLMIVSVMKNTKHPVKFWLLENPLSHRFKTFLPKLAQEYKFDYQYISYNWPFWLNHQTEKQRIVWGYKILFLDVLFPLNIERVIFVDADQIVRTDLWELMTINLHGAPYGYTPFCKDRPEMAKYRFWDHGYWKNHLQGRPYHISALYVIDLIRFRQMGAGDMLRTTYHELSQDPNSLANLDQDLPNHMIHHLPIFSLPQKWLWCETWCSDASKKKAKTIDLCNNPKTKEPKLKAAVRIVEEWASLDNEVSQLRDRVFSIHSNVHTEDPPNMAKDEL